MRQIREWLEKKGDYATGLALYETHGKSRVVVNSLRRGESEFTRGLLRRELEKICGDTVTTTVTAAEPTAGQPTAAEASRGHGTRAQPPTAGEASPGEALRAQRSAWFAERHRLHAQLELVPTDEQRRQHAERILELSDYLTASYRDAPLPAAAPRPDLSRLTDQAEIRRLLANLRPQASKLKKNPARALDLQLVRADIAQLETLLATLSCVKN